MQPWIATGRTGLPFYLLQLSSSIGITDRRALQSFCLGSGAVVNLSHLNMTLASAPAETKVSGVAGAEQREALAPLIHPLHIETMCEATGAHIQLLSQDNNEVSTGLTGRSRRPWGRAAIVTYVSESRCFHSLSSSPPPLSLSLLPMDQTYFSRIAAAGAALAAVFGVSYAIYFDHRRRHDPVFRKKLGKLSTVFPWLNPHLI